MLEEFSKGVASREIFGAPGLWDTVVYDDQGIIQIDLIWRCSEMHENTTYMQIVEFSGRNGTDRYWYLRDHLCDTCGEPASIEECTRAHNALWAKIEEPPYPHPDYPPPDIRPIIDLHKYVIPS